MDDPWANAWGEPSKASTSNWSAPSVSSIHGDHEDDISTRSWSVEPTTQWGDTGPTEASLWRNEPSSAWQPAHSTFDTIPLSTVPAQLPQFPTSSSEEPEKSSSSDNSPPSSPISETPSLSPSVSPNPLHISRTATPDAFGTFKGADELEEPIDDSWKPTLSLPDADTWTPSWGESNEENSVKPPGTAEALDIAWETAKEQKARQDLHVPPELLASILSHLEEMSGELWPDTDASIDATEDEMSLESEIVVSASIAQKFMPDDLTLPSNVQFTNTFISKQLIEALKLTKHAPQTLFSPMAMYMSSKGSTSWEASIKSQPNITHEDFAPAGWKIVETAKESTVIDDSKKKTGSGLLSFFGRRTTSSQPDAISRSNSPPITGSDISSIKTGSLPRASTDNMKSTPTSQDSGRTTPALPIATSSSSSISFQKNDPNSTTSTVASDSVVREATPPPSAVSRFLGRFSSRPKPRESLSLSQDDLEFLSDVPTFGESESNRASELDALSMMIKSPPLPTTLPPPLPPPPSASQPTRTLSQTTKLEKDPMKDPVDNDPFSIFNSSDSASNPIHTPMNSLIGVSTPPVTGSNSSVSPTAPPLADSRNSGSTISNQGWSLFDDFPAPVNETVPPMTPPNNYSTPPPVPRHKPQGSSSQKQSLGRNSLVLESTGIISPLSPPPRSSSHTPSHNFVSRPVINLDNDDDDFSEFLSSPAQSAPPAPLSFSHNAVVKSPSSSIDQTPSTTTNSIFDGFDEFLGPFSSGPQPPLPPAKQMPKPSVPASNVTNTPPPNKRRPQHSRTVSKADHNRTLSLLENVASRGRWLGPASPLPEALSPPGGSNMKPSGDNNYFNHGSSMQAQQAQATATLLAPTLVADEKKPLKKNSSHQLSPAFTFPPPVSSQPPLLKPPTLHASSMNTVVSPTKVKSGGLSAQDLSFFEGL